jgi:hypothetical protein
MQLMKMQLLQPELLKQTLKLTELEFEVKSFNFFLSQCHKSLP